jgi:hypothetical protein
LVIGSLVASCGRSGDTTSESSPTRAQFIKRGDKVCLKLGKRAGAALAAYFDKAKASSGKTQTKEVNELSLPLYQDEAEELRELTPPAGEEQTVEAIITGFEKGVKGMERELNTPLSTAPGTPFYLANMAARRYGFQVCGR